MTGESLFRVCVCGEVVEKVPFTDKKPVSLPKNCDDPSRSRSPGSARGARIHQTLESKTLPLQKEKCCVRLPGDFIRGRLCLIHRGGAARSRQMRTESPPLDTRERRAASSPLSPSPSLSRAGSRFLGTRLWRHAANLERRVRASAHGSAGTATRKQPATPAGSPQKLVQNTAGPCASPGIERCECTVILLQVSGTSSSSSTSSPRSSSLCR